jgi:Thioredoxin domain-containing protein
MSKPVFYDFFATWCGPCRMQTPIVEELEKKLADKVDFRVVDVDQNPELAAQYEIAVVPTLIIEVDGKVMHRIEGLTDGATLESLLSAFF